MVSNGTGGVPLSDFDDELLDDIWDFFGDAEDPDYAETEKHLSGKHNQMSHAGGRAKSVVTAELNSAKQRLAQKMREAKASGDYSGVSQMRGAVKALEKEAAAAADDPPKLSPPSVVKPGTSEPLSERDTMKAELRRASNQELSMLHEDYEQTLSALNKLPPNDPRREQRYEVAAIIGDISIEMERRALHQARPASSRTPLQPQRPTAQDRIALADSLRNAKDVTDAQLDALEALPATKQARDKAARKAEEIASLMDAYDGGRGMSQQEYHQRLIKSLQGRGRESTFGPEITQDLPEYPEARQRVQQGFDFARQVTRTGVTRDMKTAILPGTGRDSNFGGTIITYFHTSNKTKPHNIAHEAMHGVEIRDSLISAQVRRFRDRRTRGEAAVSMREAAGPRFHPSEMTKRDRWVDPYIGRVYGAKSTELSSMFVQYLYQGDKILARDPEFMAEMAYILGWGD